MSAANLGGPMPDEPEEKDGCNLCGCVWDEDGYCACDRVSDVDPTGFMGLDHGARIFEPGEAPMGVGTERTWDDEHDGSVRRTLFVPVPEIGPCEVCDAECWCCAHPDGNYLESPARILRGTRVLSIDAGLDGLSAVYTWTGRTWEQIGWRAHP